MSTKRWGLFFRGGTEENEEDPVNHNEFNCPITCDLMMDPVVCADGTSYERTAIEQWLSVHNTSPLTGAVLPHKNLVPNLSLRALVEDYRHRTSGTIAPHRSTTHRAIDLPMSPRNALLEVDLPPMPSMDRNEARKFLIDHVTSGWTTNTSAAAGCEILSCITVHPVVTKIENFVETRERRTEHAPYVSGPFTMRADGSPPDVWSIPCAEEPHFQYKTEEVEIPYTTQLETCVKCRGLGSGECTECNGTLEKKCRWCNGRSEIQTTCQKCEGSGRMACEAKACDRGLMKCADCLGSGEVKSFEVMYRKLTTISFARSTGTTISDRDLSSSKIHAAAGKVIYSDTALQVVPPSDFTGEIRNILRAVQQQSADKMANVTHQGGRVLQQRLSVTQVPITLTKAVYEGTYFHWYVYGSDHVVCAFGYPNTCCEWCNRCSIS